MVTRYFLAAAFAILLLASASSAYYLNATREEMLTKYQTYVEPKIPKSARMLVGDERVNVYVGRKVLGIETKRGELSSFELRPVESPSVVVTISDSAAEKIEARKMGILQAIDSGGIKIDAKNFFSALKIETMKRIYAVSGADDELLGKKKGSARADTYNSIYVQRARIANSLKSE